MKKILKAILWLWTPKYEEPEPKIIPLDELGRIRYEKINLKSKLLELERKEEEVEKSLMSERADDLLKKIFLFKSELRGDLFWRFNEMKKSLDNLKKIDSTWTQFLLKHYEQKPETQDRSERAFLVTFLEAMSKPNRDLGDAISYLSGRRKGNNPFIIRGKF